MKQPVSIAKRDKRKRLVLPAYVATSALERKLNEAKGAKEVICPPAFFTGRY